MLKLVVHMGSLSILKYISVLKMIHPRLIKAKAYILQNDHASALDFIWR